MLIIFLEKEIQTREKQIRFVLLWVENPLVVVTWI